MFTRKGSMEQVSKLWQQDQIIKNDNQSIIVVNEYYYCNTHTGMEENTLIFNIETKIHPYLY